METPSFEQILAKLQVVEPTIKSRSNITKSEINWICQNVIPIFLSQPCLLELNPPLTIVGDIHGQFIDLIRIFEIANYPPYTNYLFLGDYVDRGFQSIDTICLLLLFKLKYPLNIHILRGNHECSYISKIYGFYDECMQYFDYDVWRMLCDVFNCLPIAAIVDQKIFCVHGGLSPHLESIDQIRNMERPVEVSDSGLLCDLLWSDPSPEAKGWGENERGTSCVFGEDQVEEFLDKFGFDLVCRAHQAVMNGFEFPFSPNKCLVTIFSAPNYCYEYDNSGAFLQVDKDLYCKFSIINPLKLSTEELIEVERASTPPISGRGVEQNDFALFEQEK